ncbi:MAG: hypothetical protein HC883_01200 [Bdellovibrionaceae bacterium]|nr:hypothetical protein [Pseudobdellovibrionaceae bacterium]
MDMEILKKRISSYRTPKGRLTRVPDELLMDVLKAWEQWTGPATGFYSSLGADHRKMAGLIGRAKKLKRDGVFPEESFKEIKVVDASGVIPGGGPCQGIEIVWESGKLIRFAQVEVLIDFLKKVA